MVRNRITDGTRLGELLASEIHGRESSALGGLTVSDAIEGADPVEGGAFAYGINRIPLPEQPTDSSGSMNDKRDGSRIATVHIHPDRLHIEFEAGVETAADVGRDAGLRVRPKAVEPPRTLVFVEAGAEVKRACDVLASVATSTDIVE